MESKRGFMSINNNRIISNNVTPKTGVLFHDHKSNNNILSTRFNNNNNNRNHEGDSLGSRYNSKDSANSSLLSMFSTYNNSLNCKQSGSTTSSLSSFSQQELSSNLTQKKRKEKIKYSIFNSSTSSLTDLSDIGNNSTVNTNYGGNSSSLNLILENQSLLEWIEQGLDRCGIDSTVYGVYVLSLLNNLTTDLDESEVKQISTNVPQRTRSPSVSRYCDFHQRLYPGLNLRQSRIKLLRSESKHLNTQKAASTTKFMHKRYQQQQQQQNGVRGASPVGFESLIDDDLSDTAATRHCPDCAHQRNNYGTSTCSWNDRPSTIVSHEKHLYNNNRSRIVDYRKATIIDCLRDATDQDLAHIDSFVGELVQRYDQQHFSTIQSSVIDNRGLQKENISSQRNMDVIDSQYPPITSNGKKFPQKNNFSMTNTTNAMAYGENQLFQHSRSLDQYDSTNQQVRSGDSLQYQNQRSKSFQHGKQFYSSQNDGVLNDSDITKSQNGHEPDQTKKPTTRDQALKYFAAFPALSGKPQFKSPTSSRSSSSTRQSKFSSQSSPKSLSSAKISTQSSLDDSVFIETQSESNELIQQNGSWNGLKIIKKASNAAAIATINQVEPSLLSISTSGNGSSSNSGSTNTSSPIISSSSNLNTKPPTLSGTKNRVMVAAAPSSLLLLDSTRDMSNFTTLKKKNSVTSSSSSSSSVKETTINQRKTSSNTTTSSSFEIDDQKRPKLKDCNKQTTLLQQQQQNLASNITTNQLVTREQEKIFNIMPSFLNPLNITCKTTLSTTNRSTITSTTTLNTTISTTMTTMAPTNNKSGTSHHCYDTTNGYQMESLEQHGMNRNRGTNSSRPVRSSMSSIDVGNVISGDNSHNTPTTTTTTSVSSSTSSAVDLLPSFLKRISSTSTTSSGTSNITNTNRKHRPQLVKYSGSTASMAATALTEEYEDTTRSGARMKTTCTTTTAMTNCNHMPDTSLNNVLIANVAVNAEDRTTSTNTLTNSDVTNIANIGKECKVSYQPNNISKTSSIQAEHRQFSSNQHEFDIDVDYDGNRSQPLDIKDMGWIVKTPMLNNKLNSSMAMKIASTTTGVGHCINQDDDHNNNNNNNHNHKGNGLERLSSTSSSSASSQFVPLSNNDQKTDKRLMNDYWFKNQQDYGVNIEPTAPINVKKGMETMNHVNDDCNIVNFANNDDEKVDDVDRRRTMLNSNNMTETVAIKNYHNHNQSSIIAKDSKDVIDESVNDDNVIDCHHDQVNNSPLVIDNKKMLDQLMNTIMQHQKQKRQIKSNHQQRQSIPQSSQTEMNQLERSKSINNELNIQEFVDSIQQSLEQTKNVNDSIDTKSSWKPSLTNYDTLSQSATEYQNWEFANQFGPMKEKTDYVSLYWNKNCTLGYMHFAEQAKTRKDLNHYDKVSIDNEQTNSKSYREYMDEQKAFRNEISLLSEIFQQSQNQIEKQPEQYENVSLVNHESELSAFQIVNKSDNQKAGFYEILSNDVNLANANFNNLSLKNRSPDDGNYFQPIEPDTLIELDWAIGKKSTNISGTTTSMKETSTSSSSSSSSGNSISVSRSELDAYFTPDESIAIATSSVTEEIKSDSCSSTLEIISGMTTTCSLTGLLPSTMATTSTLMNDTQLVDKTTISTSMHSAITCPSYGGSCGNSSSQSKMIDSYGLRHGLQPRQKSTTNNANCECKNKSNGCYRFPEEYNCRIDRTMSPFDSQICDKSINTVATKSKQILETMTTLTTTDTDNSNIFDLNYIGFQPPEPTFGSSTLVMRHHIQMNQPNMIDNVDEGELNVDDLVNDVLRLSIDGADDSIIVEQKSTSKSIKSPVPLVNSTTTTTDKINPIDDDYDGPPMPYSKRKKFQNDKNRIYGKFPISSAEVQELRLLSQKRQLHQLHQQQSSRSINMKNGIDSYYDSKTSAITAITTNTTSTVIGTNGPISDVETQYNTETPFYYNSQQLMDDDGEQCASMFASIGVNDGETNTANYGDYINDNGDIDGVGGGEDVATDYYDDMGDYINENYVIGPDGAQYYVGGDGEDMIRNDLDHNSPDMFNQYDDSSYSMNVGDLTTNLGKSTSSSIYPMFDLEFKTDNPTIETIIETTAKQNQKPCSFYMEGFCARPNCKFSHDLSSITCKYWLEGFCIKDEFCPFLHGYNESNQPPQTTAESSKLDPNAKSFQFKLESDFDFPTLTSKKGEEHFPGLGDSNGSMDLLSDGAAMKQFSINGSGNCRINFTSKKVGLSKKKPITDFGTNGHYFGQQQSQKANSQQSDEEWPSLNGDSEFINGVSYEQQQQQQQSNEPSKPPIFSSSGSFQFREKVTKGGNKKSKSNNRIASERSLTASGLGSSGSWKYSKGNIGTSSSTTNTTNSNVTNSSNKYDVTLKGLI